jgi:signal transduction histidine kinase
VGRLQRQGGRVEIHSTPGEGTEVVLEVPRP